MDFFNSAVTTMSTLVTALGGGLGVWGVINLMEGYGSDNPAAKSQGVKQLMAGGGVMLLGLKVVPLLSGCLLYTSVPIPDHGPLARQGIGKRQTGPCFCCGAHPCRGRQKNGGGQHGCGQRKYFFHWFPSYPSFILSPGQTEYHYNFSTNSLQNP